MPRKYIAKIETDNPEMRDAIESAFGDPVVQKLIGILGDPRVPQKAEDLIKEAVLGAIEEGLIAALAAPTRKPTTKKRSSKKTAAAKAADAAAASSGETSD